MEYTKLLLHCNGTDGSTTFIDESGNTVTAHADAQIDTAQKKFGTGSCLLDGTGDYLSLPSSTDWLFGTGDFTIDYWARLTSFTASTEGYMRVFTSVLSNHWTIYHDKLTTQAVLRFKHVETYYGPGDAAYRFYGWYPSIDTWYHIAFVRNGSEFDCYVDGTKLTRYTDTQITDIREVAKGLEIGRGKTSSPQYFDGHLDEIRVSKGIARWTSNFTPPTSEYSIDQEEKYEDTTIHLSEETLVRPSLYKETSSETITLSETNIATKVDEQLLTDTVTLTETIDYIMSLAELETISLSEDYSIAQTRTDKWDVNCDIRTCLGQFTDIITDIRIKKRELDDLLTDIRFKKAPIWTPPSPTPGYPDPLPIPDQPIGASAFTVKINGADVTSDVDISSLNWSEDFNGNPATASFVLKSNRYDELSGLDSEDVITIYFDSSLKYYGYATYLSDASSDTIKVHSKDRVMKMERMTYTMKWGRQPDAAKTIKEALTEVLDSLVSDGIIASYDTPPGEFVPEPDETEIENATSVISRLMEDAGNYAWYIKPDGKWTYKTSGKGNIVDLPIQKIGTNLSIYQAISHDFSLNDTSSIINRAQVYLTKNKNVIVDPINPIEPPSYEDRLVFAQLNLSRGWDGKYSQYPTPYPGLSWNWKHYPSNLDPEIQKGFEECYRKYNIDLMSLTSFLHIKPGLSDEEKADLLSKCVRLDTTKPIKAYGAIKRYYITTDTGSRAGWYSSKRVTTEASYTVDIANQLVTFSEQQVYLALVGYDDNFWRTPIYDYRSCSISFAAYWWVRNDPNLLNPIDYDDDETIEITDSDDIPEPDTTDQMRFTVEVSTDVSFKVEKKLSYVSLTVDEEHSDSAYAIDMASHDLSKTANKKTEGSIELTFDACEFYGINRKKRINLNSTNFKNTNKFPLNIRSIDYNAGNYLVTLNVESENYYKRSKNYR